MNTENVQSKCLEHLLHGEINSFHARQVTSSMLLFNGEHIKCTTKSMISCFPSTGNIGLQGKHGPISVLSPVIKN